jgi:hypothetical protein
MSNRVAKAAASVNNTANSVTPPPATPPPADERSEPLADAPPLLLRLEHSISFRNDDLEVLQPVIGASVIVGHGYSGRRSSETRTVWLPAVAWEGIATIIRQTPVWYRPCVALFLEVLHGNLGPNDGLTGLLSEIIDEVRQDPYGDVPEADPDTFDFDW